MEKLHAKPNLYKQLLADVRAIVRSELESSCRERRDEQLEFLDALAAAALLNVSRTTILNWRTRGLLTSHKIGGRILFKRTELLASVEGRQTSESHPVAGTSAVNVQPKVSAQ
jgi:excisionase family DNA binding protein